jgi:hypothetical protein
MWAILLAFGTGCLSIYTAVLSAFDTARVEAADEGADEGADEAAGRTGGEGQKS